MLVPKKLYYRYNVVLISGDILDCYRQYGNILKELLRHVVI